MYLPSFPLSSKYQEGKRHWRYQQNMEKPIPSQVTYLMENVCVHQWVRIWIHKEVAETFLLMAH